MNKLFKGLVAASLALSCVSPIVKGAEDNGKDVQPASPVNDAYSFGNCFKNNLMVKVTTVSAAAELLCVGGLAYLHFVQ